MLEWGRSACHTRQWAAPPHTLTPAPPRPTPAPQLRGPAPPDAPQQQPPPGAHSPTAPPPPPPPSHRHLQGSGAGECAGEEGAVGSGGTGGGAGAGPDRSPLAALEARRLAAGCLAAWAEAGEANRAKLMGLGLAGEWAGARGMDHWCRNSVNYGILCFYRGPWWQDGGAMMRCAKKLSCAVCAIASAPLVRACVCICTPNNARSTHLQQQHIHPTHSHRPWKGVAVHFNAGSVCGTSAS